MRLWTGIGYFVFHGKAKADAGDYQQQAGVACPDLPRLRHHLALAMTDSRTPPG
jgi:hypothetical protein